MPCIAHPRGFTDPTLPWDDDVNNDPCGKAIVATIRPGFVDVSMHSLCLFHLMLKLGAKDVNPPYTFSP